MRTVEYVWIGGNNELRSKIKVLENENEIDIETIPDWNYDGSSTNQASGEDSEVIIKPRCIFKDPFQKYYGGQLVLCDTYTPDGLPLSNNMRFMANEMFNKKLDEKPWYGLEQEYFMMKNGKPLGFDESKTQGQYYCSVGAENAFGREIALKHLEYCMRAGIKLSGINAEVAPGQWEFQIGPCEGIDAGDHLWMARYILQRIGEEYDITIDFYPKPLSGNWNGSGCHTNYSTEVMRQENGLVHINAAISKLGEKHDEHMNVYGIYNELRMTGEHETASFDKFSFGIANRGASIRIGNATYNNKCGYFEDRRPSSNCDPYIVTSMIFKTTCL
jgi:glutamine synthetase